MAEQQTNLAQPGPPQLWNHRIHQRWAGEDLTYWRLVFFPRYNRQRILEIIDSVMTAEKVHAFAIYEAMGLFDLFIRAWLPSKSSENLERALRDALEPESVQLIDSFSVTRVLRHYAWETGRDSRLDPEESVLSKPFSDPAIERLNRGEFSPDEQQKLLDERILAPVRPLRTVQFLTILSSTIFSMTNEVQAAMREGLLKRIRESSVRQATVYEGTGFGQYIVTGRAGDDGMGSITDLSTAINDLVLESGVLSRPYTHICAHPIPLFYADRLPPLEEDRSCDIDALLGQDESRTLEVRATLGEDLVAWLNEGRAAIPTDTLIDDGVIKTVVGMLNADGGQVVIGAVRRDAEIAGVRASEHSKLKDLPQRGEYLCIGVNREYRAGGWEEFRSRLNDLLATKIQPPPVGSVSITRNVVENGVDVWVISIQPSHATWFYRVLSDSGPVNFFVREESRTVSYAGVEADIYKRQRPRG